MTSSSDNLFDHLRDTLRKSMNEYADHVCGGGCKDYSEYSKACGIIEGLAIAEREILDLKQRMESA